MQKYLVGRAPDCTVKLPDRSSESAVGTLHATIIQDADGIVIETFKPSYYLFVNNFRVARKRITPADTIRVGTGKNSFRLHEYFELAADRIAAPRYNKDFTGDMRTRLEKWTTAAKIEKQESNVSIIAMALPLIFFALLAFTFREYGVLAAVIGSFGIVGVSIGRNLTNARKKKKLEALKAHNICPNCGDYLKDLTAADVKRLQGHKCGAVWHL